MSMVKSLTRTIPIARVNYYQSSIQILVVGLFVSIPEYPKEGVLVGGSVGHPIQHV